MKKILTGFLCILLCISFVPEALAADIGVAGSNTSLNWESRDISFENDIALKMEQIRLLQGVGKHEDGTTDFGLDRQVTRMQAVLMVIRLLGKGAEAAAYPKTHPFTDVPNWADSYVSYAYDKGITKGVSGTRFGTADKMGAAGYLTFMLRILGYTDKNYIYGDYEGYYSSEFASKLPWALASYCGILPTQVDKADFLRSDLIDITCATLYAHMKDSSVQMKDKLINEGVFTKAQFDAAFPQDPFAYYREIDKQISAAIAGKEAQGHLAFDKYSTECHLIIEMYQENGVITIKPMVCNYETDFQEDNTLGTNGGGTGPWVIKLDANTLKCLECYSCNELGDQGLSWEDILPGKSKHASYLSQGMDRVCRMETQLLLKKGVIGYRQPTYNEALARINTYLEITQTIETTSCTILIGETNTSHGNYADISLIYKSGSAVGEGKTVSLPMPSESCWNRTSQPDKLWLSDDALILYYSYHYDEPLVSDEGTPMEHIEHQAGTYHYTTDLKTGKTSLSIIVNK
ncbi:S-layer homology domain-containing protein [Oscillibacter valericigenes]|nr:S-layer homology domain-containing protein [Oscillibacter valericigenes]